jgi:hypothetical protein
MKLSPLIPCYRCGGSFWWPSMDPSGLRERQDYGDEIREAGVVDGS